MIKFTLFYFTSKQNFQKTKYFVLNKFENICSKVRIWFVNTTKTN